MSQEKKSDKSHAKANQSLRYPAALRVLLHMLLPSPAQVLYRC
jgi:hypothetical protein